MMQTDGTLGAASTVERAKSCEPLNLPHLSPMQKEAYLKVGEYRRCNPDVSALAACKALGLEVSNYYAARKRVEASAGEAFKSFSEKDKIRPDSPILVKAETQALARSQAIIDREIAVEVDLEDQAEKAFQERVVDRVADEISDEEADEVPDPIATKAEALTNVIAWLQPFSDSDRQRIYAAVGVFYNLQGAAHTVPPHEEIRDARSAADHPT